MSGPNEPVPRTLTNINTSLSRDAITFLIGVMEGNFKHLCPAAWRFLSRQTGDKAASATSSYY
jgi:hypothetical protein